MQGSGVAPAGRIQLTVVLAARGAEATVAASVAEIARHLDGRGVAHEILIVDDGSTDATAEAAGRALASLRGRVVRHRERRGTGAAVRTGVLAAAGRWVLIAGARPPSGIEHHEALARACRERDLDGAFAVADGPPGGARDRVVAALARAVLRAGTGLAWSGLGGGPALLDRERVLPLFEQAVVDGDAWGAEIRFLCARLGIEVVEVPADAATPYRLRAVPGLIRDLARVRWRFRRGLYRGAGAPGAAPPR